MATEQITFSNRRHANTITFALGAARKGATVVVTGLSRTDTLASIPLFPFVMQEKRLIGSLYGSGQPLKDIPQLVSLHQEGKLKLRGTCEPHLPP